MKLARIHRDEVGSKSIMTFCRIVHIMKLLILFAVADSMSFCRGVCRCTKNSAGADDQILMCRVNSRDCGPAFYYPGIGGQCNETRPGRLNSRLHKDAITASKFGPAAGVGMDEGDTAVLIATGATVTSSRPSSYHLTGVSLIAPNVWPGIWCRLSRKHRTSVWLLRLDTKWSLRKRSW